MILVNPLSRKAPSKKYESLNGPVWEYIVNNFFNQLHIDEINEMNVHHIVDALIAQRDVMFGLGYVDLVDEINYCLEEITEYLVDVDGENVKAFKKYNYREPNVKNLSRFFEQDKNNKKLLKGKNL